jgi:hypothetical protein
MFKKSVFIASVCLFLISFSHAQGVGGSNYSYTGQDLNTITTAVPFLLIAPDSRGGSMGDIGGATSADVFSQHYNPAKNVFNKNTFGVGFSYSPWLRGLVNDINLAYLSSYWKITKNDAIAFSLRYFSLGNIDFTGPTGEPISTQRPNEFAIDFSYSRKLIDQLSIAIAPRFIYSDLTARQFVENTQETKPGLAGAADIALFYEQDFRFMKTNKQTLRIGFNISNIGNKMSYSDGTLRRDFISTNMKIGAGYTMEFDPYNKLTIGVEANKLLVPTQPVYSRDSITGQFNLDPSGNRIILAGKDPDVPVATGIFQSFYDAPGGASEEFNEVNWATGLEYSYMDAFFVRTGYFYEHKTKGNRQFITVGVGFKWSIIGLDVSYLFSIHQNHPLENTMRFSLNFDFASFDKDKIQKQNRFSR